MKERTSGIRVTSMIHGSTVWYIVRRVVATTTLHERWGVALHLPTASTLGHAGHAGHAAFREMLRRDRTHGIAGTAQGT